MVHFKGKFKEIALLKKSGFLYQETLRVILNKYDSRIRSVKRSVAEFDLKNHLILLFLRQILL